jgi:3-oxoacyl-[acyl-carrier-protein] synthase II
MDKQNMQKVVVTGMGAITPIGNTVSAFSAALKEGKSGLGLITQFDTTDFDVKIAAEVKDFNPADWMEAKAARKMARFTQFAVAAAAQALDQAGLIKVVDGKRVYQGDSARAGVVLGNGIGGFQVVTESFHKLFYEGPRRMLPLTVPMMISNEAGANIAIINGFHGPAFTMVTACSSGTDALGEALDLLRMGRADMMVAGGTEACITAFGVGSFQMIKALAVGHTDDPAVASRPFDAARSGFVMGEGAGVLVLETEAHAKARGARILAEFAGYGANCDAYHITAPEPTGESGAVAVRLALEDAGVAPEDVQYYNAHGTSTELNDPTETAMVKKAFGAHAYKMKVSSIKSMTGHCLGGSGGLEAIACVLAIDEGFYPPTINLDHPDPACDLDYVPNKVQYGDIRVAASGNLGFGGHNGVVVFRKYEG